MSQGILTTWLNNVYKSLLTLKAESMLTMELS